MNGLVKSGLNWYLLEFLHTKQFARLYQHDKREQIVGSEPADLTVHPPQTIEGGLIFVE